MPLEASCAQCRKQYRVPDKFAGKTIKCPGCQGALKLPPAEQPAATHGTTVQATCASCQHSLKLSAKYAGKRVKCPKCGAAVTVPPASTPRPVPPVAAAPPAPVSDFPPIATQPQEAAPEIDFPGITVPGGAPPIASVPPVQGAAPPAAPAGQAATYEPVLRSTGKTKSMANMAVGGDLKKTKRGNAITSSMIYQVGEARSFWDRVKSGTHVGPFVKEVETRVDQLHVMKISDPAGAFQMIIPYDNGNFCPVEFMSVMPGRLPASLGLLRGKGGNWGIETSNSSAGVFLPQYLRSAMTAVGGQAESVWVVLNENQPQTAGEIANRAAELRSGLRFDAKLTMGPMEITYHIDWIAQALPLSDDQYLLAAQFIPERKMFGVGLGASWFVQWRQQFVKMASQLPAGTGEFQCFDYGNWATVAQEVMGLQVL